MSLPSLFEWWLWSKFGAFGFPYTLSRHYMDSQSMPSYDPLNPHIGLLWRGGDKGGSAIVLTFRKYFFLRVPLTNIF